MYAIINISGKQYKAISGARIRVPKQDGESGTSLTFDKVLLINDGKNTEIGNPILKGVSVDATIIDHGRDKKILVYKKKRRKGYQRKNGHRQWFTEIEFNSIKTVKTQSSQQKTMPIEKSLQEEE
jgi:large subunit ribosomal protein L21